MYVLNNYPGWIPTTTDKSLFDLNDKNVSVITKHKYSEEYNPNNIYNGFVVNDHVVSVVLIDNAYQEVLIPLSDVVKYMILEYFEHSVKKDKVIGRFADPSYSKKPITSPVTEVKDVLLDKLARALNLPSDQITYKIRVQ